MGDYIEEAQAVAIARLRQELEALKNSNQKLQIERNNVVGIMVGALHQWGDPKAGILRIKKKHMMRANPRWSLFPEIDNITKDLIVRFLDMDTIPTRPRKKAGGQCQSTTTNAKDVENNSKCGTSESTTSQKSAQDAESPQPESTTPNNT